MGEEALGPAGLRLWPGGGASLAVGPGPPTEEVGSSSSSRWAAPVSPSGPGWGPRRKASALGRLEAKSLEPLAAVVASILGGPRQD